MSRTRSGIFWRTQGGEARAYARLQGGRRIALRLAGSGRAVTDPALAQKLYTELVNAEQARALRGLHHVPEPTTFAEAASAFLVAKAEEASTTTQWLEGEELRLHRAIAYLGGDRQLSGVGAADMKRHGAALRRQGLRGRTIPHHPHTVGALYRWSGANEVAAEGTKP